MNLKAGVSSYFLFMRVEPHVRDKFPMRVESHVRDKFPMRVESHVRDNPP